jgi:hypothetical protein
VHPRVDLLGEIDDASREQCATLHEIRYSRANRRRVRRIPRRSGSRHHSLPEAEIVWFDEKGGEIARRRTIDAAIFRGRQNVARALAYYKGRIVAETTFVFEREPDCPCSCRRIEPRRTRRAKESNP